MSVAKRCLAFSGLFEAELLIELMLRFWQHPNAADEVFRNDLLESTAEVLRACLAGQPAIADVPAKNTGFVAAAWFVEWSALASGAEDRQGLRQAWLERVRKAVPSCFCSPDDLP